MAPLAIRCRCYRNGARHVNAPRMGAEQIDQCPASVRLSVDDRLICPENKMISRFVG